jgi:hypothetical protein
MRLEPLGRTGKLALHIAFGAVNIVSEDVQSRPISLRLNGHWFLRLWSHRVTHAQLMAEVWPWPSELWTDFESAATRGQYGATMRETGVQIPLREPCGDGLVR